MTSEKHLSVFELDTWFASRPGERVPAVSRHLETCATCRQYVGALEADRVPRPAPRRFIPIAAAALALAAAVFLFVRSRPRDDDRYIGVKGDPAAQVLVRSGGRVRLWDGVSRVRAGDALAVRVACAEFVRVTVASSGSRAWEGPCTTAASEALPFTLVVDSHPGREHFDVVLSRERLDDERLANAIRSAARTRDIWTIAFDFDKEETR
jgi:hypothetical protein